MRIDFRRFCKLSKVKGDLRGQNSSRFFSIYFFLFSSMFIMSGCKKSVSVKEGPDAPNYLSPEVESPTISLPGRSPYFSNDTHLIISGLCGDGHMVYLTGEAFDSIACENKSYAFSVSQNIDGLYNYYITQTFKGVISKPTALAWQRKTSVPPPDVTYPSVSLYKSAETILSIQGNCESGSRISLSGDGTGTVTCVNSNFNLALPKFSDGDYSVIVTQTDLAGNQASTNFLWQKRVLAVSPSGPTIIATQAQVFAPTGGSDNYTLVLQNNNSGASFDSNTRTYTAGTLAGVTDKIVLTDSLGATLDINIQVAADLPDHFVLPVDSGADQIQTVAQDYTSPLKVQVVDQFGNGISAYPVVFVLKVGDVEFLSPSIQSTDASGFASLYLKQGFLSNNSTVTVTPVGAPLPDLAGSGQSIISLNTLGKTNNSGNFDLNFNVSNNPDNILMADFNEDGELDIAIINKGDPSIGLLMGQTSALFNTQTKITSVCATPYAMIQGDFNEDSHQDLLLTCSDKFSLYTGVGNGTFSAAVNTSLDLSENLPVDIAVGDFNGDNHLDTATVSLGANLIAVRLGLGNGSFSAASLLSTGAGSSPSKIAIADIDKVNGVDIIVINSAQNSIGVFFNDGVGGFSAQVSFSTGVAPSDLIISDYNNDSYFDVSTTNNIDNNLSVLLNDQAGGLNLAINTLTGQGPTSHYAEDINKDGNVDILVTNNIDNNMSVLMGFGNGTFNVGAPIALASNPIDIIIRETNGDVFEDILVVSSGEKKIQVFPVQAGGAIGYKNSLGNGPRDAVIGDLNGDGYIDQAIVNSGDNNIVILRGNGTGLFSSFSTVGTSSGPIAIEMADLDRDNDLDLVTVNQNVNSVQVFINDGSGSFSTPVSYGSGSQPASVKIVDLNKDGILDMIIANSGANTLSFFPGVGDGTFGVRLDTATGSQPSSLASADMNQDGVLDLIVTHQSANNVGVYFGNGNGTFQPPSNYSAQTGTNSVAVGYFNADLNVDVAVSNNLAGSVSVFFGNSNGTLGLPVNYNCGADPISLKSADVNGDNNEDLIVGNGLNQKATVLFGSFFGDFSSSKILPTNINTINVEVSDVNNDGSVDLFFIDGTNNETKLLMGL
ncbi:MAG: VCBS repeat-containing protein [Bdellovibrionaceae bacterium]|nr:VCBS repeat-containing protein [Pseudobdellovibrionaceae bacterium]